MGSLVCSEEGGSGPLKTKKKSGEKDRILLGWKGLWTNYKWVNC